VFAKPLAELPKLPAAIPEPAPLPAPPVGSVTATLAGTLAAAGGGIDVDNDGKADPGDTIAYTLTLTNSSGAAATGLAIANPLDPHTTFVPGSLNSTPVAFDQLVSLNEDATLQITLQGQDPDGSNLTFRDSVGNPFGASIPTAHGSVGSFGSASCDTNGVCSLTATYTPSANYNGSDSFAFKVNDGTANSNEVGTVSITVNAVNDAPTFTVPGNPAAVNEDAGAQSVSSFITGVRPAQVGNTTEDGQTVSFVITNNTNTGLFSSAPTLTVSGASYPKTATLAYTPAANQNGTATITYHAHDDGGTANGGVDNSADQTFTITVNAVNDPPVVVAPAAYTAQANMKISGLTGLLGNVNDNADNGVNGCVSTTFTVTAGSISGTSAHGGNISNVNLSTGTFDYDPPAGYTGTDTFTYTVSDTGCPGPGVASAAATVTINVIGPVIWFVDTTLAVAGTGRLSAPFNTLLAATTAMGVNANQRIFVFGGSTTAVGTTVTLQGNNSQATQPLAQAQAQWLIGQGVIGTGFDNFFGISPPAGTIARPSISGTRPKIQGTVTMKENTVVQGLNIDVSAGSTKGLTASSLTAGTSGSKLLIKDVNVTSAGGNAVDFTSAQTIEYLSSGSGQVNTISSTTGTALNVTSTIVGAGGLNFRSISSNGGANGIVLNTPSSSGGLSITGDGSAAGSGGTIQNKTQGAVITSTSNLVMKFMNFTKANTGNGTCNNVDNSTFNSTCQAAINLTSVTTATLDHLNMDNADAGGVGVNGQVGINLINSSALTLSNSTVQNFGDAPNEDNLRFWNLTGTCSITNSTFRKGGEFLADLRMDTGTLTLSVTGSTFDDTASAPFGAAGFSLTSTSASSMTVTVDGNQFTKIKNAGLQGFSKMTSTMNIDIINNTFDPTGGAGGGIGRGPDLESAGTSHLNFNINHNTKIYGKNGSAVNIVGFNTSVLQGRVDNNTDIRCGGVGSPGTGVVVSPQDDSTGTVEVIGNTISQIGKDNGVTVLTHGDGASAHSATLDATVTNNTITLITNGGSGAGYVGGLFGIQAQGGSNANDTVKTCADVRNNAVSATPTAINNTDNIAFRARAGSTSPNLSFLYLENFNTNATTTWNNNGNTPTNSVSTSIASGGTISAPPAGSPYFGVCRNPSNPTALLIKPAKNDFEVARLATAGVDAGQSSVEAGVTAEIMRVDGAAEAVKVATPPQPSVFAGTPQTMTRMVNAVASMMSPTAYAASESPAEISSDRLEVSPHSLDLRNRESAEGRRLDIRANHATRPEIRGQRLEVRNHATTGSATLVPTPVGQFPINGTGNGQGFTLPDGKTITIKFKATLNNPPNLSGVPPGTPQVSAQGTLTGAFVGNPIVTDDPGTVAANDATVTPVDLFDTTTTLGAAPAAGSWNVGQSVTFTATVAPNPANATTVTGTVVFKDNGTAIAACNGATGVTISAGAAQCVVTFGSGAHSVQAFYSGDGNYDPSTSNTLSQGAVNQSGTTTSVTSSLNPSVVTQSVTFTATVTSNTGFSGPPTGTVTFKDGVNTISCTGGNQTLNGSAVATCQISTLTVGNHTITAVYNGDTNFTTSTGSLTAANGQNGNPQVVNQAGATVTLVSSLNPSLVTQNVTFTGTVSSNGGLGGTPTGTLTFKDGGSPITCSNGGGQTLSGGVGTCQIATLSAGNHTITVDYSGDTNFSAVNGTQLTANGGQNGNPQVVNKSNTTTTLSPNPPSPATPGSPVVFTATVASTTAVTGPPAGTVQFVDNIGGPITCTGAGESNTNTGEALVGGSAHCTTSTLSVAVHSITATYTGDGSANGSATFNGSTSAPLSYTVGNPCSSSVVVTSSADSGADTLREAIDTKVCDGGTITFDPGVTSITLASELHFTTKNMTITGPGSGTLTISGNNATRIFDVDSGRTITISGVTLSSGKVTGAAGGPGLVGSTGSGGAVLNGGALTLSGVVINGGQAIGGVGGANTGAPGGNGGDAFGGGVLNSGTLILNNSTVNGGAATGGAGGNSDGANANGNGGNAFGGGVYNTGTLTLNGSTISSNTSTGGGAGTGGAGGLAGSGNGGGIYNNATASPNTVSISGTTINGNAAGANGGGIFNTGTASQATLNISNSTISGNHANNNGGGISNTGDTGATTLTSVTITGNDSDHDNDTNGDGGGIIVVSGTVVLKNTIVGGNVKSPGTPIANDIFGTVDAANSSFNLIGDAGSSGTLTGGSNNNIVGVDMTTVLNPTLADNGGPTKTHALVASSPALESGNSFGLTTDQRGFARPVNSDGNAPLNGGDDADIGAYELQNQPPAPNAPTLDPASDTGTLGDNITGDTSPKFNITGVISGATVDLLRDDDGPGGNPPVVVASGIAAGTTIQLTDPGVAAGTHSYTARQTVSGAPTSAQSGATQITIDTSTPATPDTPDLQAVSDSGISSSDNLTNAINPVFDIGNVTNTFTVELLRDGNVVASGVANSSTIQLTDNNPSEGAHNYTARQTNGVTPSSQSAPLQVTFDRTAPPAPGTPDLQAASDTFGAGTGGTNTDNITNAGTRLFDVVITPEANSTVTLLRGGNAVTGSTVTGDSSPKTLTDAEAIADNTYQYTVRHTDAAGNSSVSASALSVTLDTTVSANAPDLQAASDSFGAGTTGTNSDNITKTTPRSFDVTGTENGSNVELLRDNVSIAFTGGTGGTVTLVDSTVLADGQYHYQTRQTDVAGNVQTSADLIVTIDTTGDAPGTPDLQAGSDAGTSQTDNRTNNGTHSFDIASLTGAFVELLRDGVAVSSTTAGGASVTLQDTASLADGVYHYTVRQTDLAGNVATSAGTLDVTIDTTAPAVASDVRASANPTSAATVDFTVTFTEPVTGVDASDFAVTNFGGVSGTSVTNVSGSGATYTVTVNTGTGDGSLRLDVLGDGTIKDVMNLAFTGTTFTSGEAYTVDRSNPSVVSITRAGSSPTNAATVTFTVTFSETVTGVDTTDFALTTTGVAGASVSSVSGSGSTRSVIVNTGTGSGTIRLDLIDDDSIVDVVNKPLGGPGAGNGNFTSGQVYTIDKTAPTVTINQANTQSDPVTGPSATTVIHFTAIFSEPVTDFASAAVSISGTAGATTASITQIAPNDGTTYDVGLQGMTQSGTVIASIIASSTHDVAGNGNAASTSTDNTVTFNKDDFTAFVVNSTADTDDSSCDPVGTGNGCTLREAINAANADAGVETITFDSTVFASPGPYTINLTSALPDITEDVTIQGPGANVLTVKRNTGGNYRIFNVTATGTVTFSGLTISNGNLPGGGIQNASTGTVNVTNSTLSGNSSLNGGGIFNNSTGTVNVTNSTLSGNSANTGGGIFDNAGTVNVTNSTLSGNSAGSGGGIFDNAGTVNVTNSTLSGNSAASNSGGIQNLGGTVTIKSTIVAGNSAPTGPDINGTVNSEGFNLIKSTSGATINETLNAGTNITGQDPQLNPLANNGGPTLTHSLQCTSPAIDKGKAFGLTTDQRGGTRPFDFADSVYPNATGGDGSDIGAYEAQAAGGCLPTAVPPNPPPSTNEDTPVVITLTGTYSQNVALSFTITQNPTIGQLGSLSAPNCNFNLSMTCTSTVTYTPNPNLNGSDLFKFKVSASGLDADPADVNVTVNAVNDPPTFLQAGNQTVSEDAGPQSVPNFITAFSPGPADESGQTVQFIVTNNTNPGLFSAAPAIDASGTLTYTPAASGNGVATITIVAKDSGGGNDASAPQSFTITVLAVNDAPVNNVPGAQTVLENGTLTFSSGNGNAISVSDVDANGNAEQVKLTATNGVITLGTTAGLAFSVGNGTANQTMTFTGTLASINAALQGMTFTSTSGFNGAASLQIVTNDQGNTGSGGALTDTDTVNITVNAGGTLQFSAATYTVAENAGPAVITITRTGGSAGTASVKIDTSNGTATAGSDYTGVSQTVTFNDGETSKTVNVAITDDLLNEPDETVNLTLSNAGGSATLGSPATAVLTIANDDPVGGYIKFSAPNYNVNEGGVATITVQRFGTLTQAATVDYATNDDSDPAQMVPCGPTPGNTLASSRCDFNSAFGRLSWAAGDGADKTFKVMTTQDSYVEGPETLTLTLSNLTGGAAFSGPSTELLTINDDAVEPPTNPVDDSNAFVEQLYRDFLNRPSDPAGKAFWVNNIDHCNDPAQRPPGQTAAQCIEISRIVTAGAFFLSIEFQATGGTAYLTNKVSFGSRPNFVRFERDAQQIGQNYVFGAPGAETILEANKVAYYNDYVTRTEFLNTYGGVSDQQYVNTLISNTGVSFTQQERDALINGLANHTETRATVLRKISEKPTFGAAEFNSMFVLMEYFGFLRRNPDQAGFDFWLNKLNSFNGDYFAAEMVKAFIECMEYRQRFGTP
jgi:CSLREA domain-containing protein